MKIMNVLIVLFAFLVMAGCVSDKKLKENVSKVIKENPALLIGAIEANPVEFVEAFQAAIQKAQGDIQKKRAEEERKKLEQSYSNPLVPDLKDQHFIGGKDAPIVLVEYSDFECPYCSRGYKTVMDMIKKYGDKVKFAYKHMPLSFHPNAMPAAKYMDAIAIQSVEKAYKFHNAIFDSQRKLKNGEKFLKSIAKKLGVNMKKLAKDIKSPKIAKKIEKDMQEAAKFGIQGTPGFVLNGVPIRGAVPVSEFEKVIDELKKRGKLTL